MVWVRLEDTFPEHPKVIVLSDQAFRTHVTGICYCSRNLTDGFIPNPAAGGGAAELVSAGIWSESESGFHIHDYLDYHPSRASVLAEREKKRKAGKKGGKATQAKHRKRRDDNGLEAGAKAGAGALLGPPTRPDPPPSKEGGRGGGSGLGGQPPPNITSAVEYYAGLGEQWAIDELEGRESA